MNQKRSVWLAPDGDSRLVRYQQEVWTRAGLVNGSPVPVHLELDEGRGPIRLPIVTGAWVLAEREPALEGHSGAHQIGVFRFGLAREKPWTIADLDALPPPPGWTWARGVLADLDLTFPHGDGSFSLWTWRNRRGWKVPPTA